MAPAAGLSASGRFLRGRIRTGLVRSRNSLFPAIQMTGCAVGAYAFAEYVLGHSGPLFAATSSLIALGFSRDPRLRRVMEVGLGCTIGIAVGDLLLHWLGGGIWQAAVVLLFSILLARFLDSGNIFTTQLGLQSLLVVLLPAPAGGPFTRSIDAIVGGVFALLVTILVPEGSAPGAPQGRPEAAPRTGRSAAGVRLRAEQQRLHPGLARADPRPELPAAGGRHAPFPARFR